MSEKKKKVDLKTSILVLLLIAILLVASTYAWFTANQTVTIEQIDVNVAASNGLQISVDGSNWKSQITNDDIEAASDTYAGATNQLPETLQAVSTAGTVSDGRVAMYLGSVDADESDDGIYKLTSTKCAAEADGSTGNYVAFDIFLKVDADTNIVLTSASDVTSKGGAVNDNGLKNASRVGFLVAADADVKAADASLTDIQGVKPSTLYVWEPNCNVHTGAAISHARDNYNTTITNSTVVGSYYGLNANITSPGQVLTSTDNMGTITANYTTLEDNQVDTDVFSLKAGITKVRVYMWVEGQDYDCENAASGKNILFDVQFSVKGSTAGTGNVVSGS